MMSTYDLDEDHTLHPEWTVDRRPPREPEPVIPPNIILGQE